MTFFYAEIRRFSGNEVAADRQPAARFVGIYAFCRKS